MQVLSVRCGLTKNLGNYESAKLEVEAAPSDGQTADQLLAEVGEYLTKQIEAASAATNGNGHSKPAKGKKSDPPLRPTEGGETPPTVIGREAPTTTPTKWRSNKVAAQAALNKGDEAFKAAKKELQYALDSETLEELLERFNNCRRIAADFGEKWEESVTKIAERFRKINSLDADPETLDALVKAFKAERQAIEKMKAEQQTDVA